MTRDAMVAVVAAASSSSRKKNCDSKKLPGIGYQGRMPWHLPADLRHFKQVTTAGTAANAGEGGKTQRNAVIMGRKTWESIPPKHRPLPGRINVVLTKSENYDVDDDDGVVVVANSFEDASQKLSALGDAVGTVFVIGGEQIYRAAYELGYIRKVIYTDVVMDENASEVEFDAFFPIDTLDDPKRWIKQPYLSPEQQQLGSSDDAEGKDKKENGPNNAGNENEVDGTDDADTDKKKQATTKTPEQAIADLDSYRVCAKTGLKYGFWEYTRRNLEELQYLDLCREIIDQGVRRGDRTGTGTLSKFGTQMRFDLRNNKLPLLTTKRTFWRGVAEELLWFISVSLLTKTTVELK